MTAEETISSVDPADWVTIWQSELAALAVDREWADTLMQWGQGWINAGDRPPGRANEPSRGRDDNPPRGRAGADAAAGAAPAGVAPGLGGPLGRGG